MEWKSWRHDCILVVLALGSLELCDFLAGHQPYQLRQEADRRVEYVREYIYSSAIEAGVAKRVVDQKTAEVTVEWISCDE